MAAKSGRGAAVHQRDDQADVGLGVLAAIDDPAGDVLIQDVPSDDIPAAGPPTQNPVVEALSALGIDYEPDLAAIRSRVETGPRLGPAAAAWTFPRGRVVAGAAVAAVALAACFVGVTHLGRGSSAHSDIPRALGGQPLTTGSSSRAGQPWSQPLTTVSSPANPGGTISVGDYPGLTDPGVTGPQSTTVPGAPTSPPGSTTPPSGSSAPVSPPSGSVSPPVSQPDLVVHTAPSSLTLSGSPLVNWIVLGARSDMVQVHSKAGSAQTLSVSQPTGSLVVPSPISIDWSGGLPEQTHSRATHWLAVPASRGLSVRIGSSRVARTITLYTGYLNLRPTVTISGGGMATVTTHVGTRSGQVRAAEITVSIPPTSSATIIGLSGSGPDTWLALAAVTIARTRG